MESRNQQVVFLYDFDRSECSISLPAVIIGQVLEIHEAHVWEIRSKTQKTAGPGHRSFALSSEQEDAGFLPLFHTAHFASPSGSRCPFILNPQKS
jgi:hypothetical protein